MHLKHGVDPVKAPFADHDGLVAAGLLRGRAEDENRPARCLNDVRQRERRTDGACRDPVVPAGVRGGLPVRAVAGQCVVFGEERHARRAASDLRAKRRGQPRDGRFDRKAALF